MWEKPSDNNSTTTTVSIAFEPLFLQCGCAMRKLGAILLVGGAGLFFFNVFNWSVGPMLIYDSGAKLGIALGAMLAVAGGLLLRRRRP